MSGFMSGFKKGRKSPFFRRSVRLSVLRSKNRTCEYNRTNRTNRTCIWR